MDALKLLEYSPACHEMINPLEYKVKCRQQGFNNIEIAMLCITCL